MTYKERGRSLAEVIVAVVCVGFLTGFVVVLCFGNYYRAKRAMERQRQRRLMRLSTGGGGGPSNYSPAHSSATSGGSTVRTEDGELQQLLAKPPEVPRRRGREMDDLLLFPENVPRKQPNIMRV